MVLKVGGGSDGGTACLHPKLVHGAPVSRSRRRGGGGRGERGGRGRREHAQHARGHVGGHVRVSANFARACFITTTCSQTRCYHVLLRRLQQIGR